MVCVSVYLCVYVLGVCVLGVCAVGRETQDGGCWEGVAKASGGPCHVGLTTYGQCSQEFSS